MAANLSTYMENRIIEFMRGNAITGEAAVYVGLFTADGGLEAGTLDNECSGGSYARELAGLDAAADGVTQNGANITFTTATAAWGTVTHFALIDAVTAGNVIMHGVLTAPRAVGDGDTAQFNATTLSITIT